MDLRRFGAMDLRTAVAIACLALMCATLQAQDAGIAASDVPQQLRDGTATIDEARAWVIGNSRGQGPGLSDEQVLSGSRSQDLDLDGRNDLLLTTVGGGSAGLAYEAFVATTSGYRHIGGFLGAIAPVARVQGSPPRLVVAASVGGGCAIVRLMQLDSDGMHEVARKSLAAGDSGTDEGRRLYRALFGAQPASDATVREIFGGPGELEVLLAGLPLARVWNRENGIRIRTVAGRHVVSIDGPGALSGMMKEILVVLVRELEP